MKIFVVGDVHISTYSSIVRTRGEVFSTRLEYLIKSLNWCEEQAVNNGCDLMVYLGDFFDRQDANSEELTSLSFIKWNTIPHVFLCGNHEIGLNDNSFNSCSVFKLRNFMVITEPTLINDFMFIPYLLNHPNLSDVVKDNVNLIFNHNDFLCSQYGALINDNCFKLEDIKSKCKLFISGHVHGDFIEENIINVGNICGQNFSEDGFSHEHHALIVDSDTHEYKLIENPYALYFYKVDISDMQMSDAERLLSRCKNNSVIAIKFDKSQEGFVDNILNNDKFIAIKKTPICKVDDNQLQSELKSETLSINHLDKLRECIHSLFNDQTIFNELEEIIK